MSHLGEMLSAYLDGELSRDEHADIHEHLDECEACRAELADLDSARAAVRSLPLLEPPVDLDLPSLGAHRRSRRRVTAGVAAAAAVLVLGVLVVRDDSRQPPIDIASVVEQHTARVSVQPGMPAFRAVSVVDQP